MQRPLFRVRSVAYFHTCDLGSHACYVEAFIRHWVKSKCLAEKDKNVDMAKDNKNEINIDVLEK